MHKSTGMVFAWILQLWTYHLKVPKWEKKVDINLLLVVHSKNVYNEKITHTIAIVNSMYPSILKVSMRMGSSSITLWYKSVYFVRSYEKNKARWKKWLNNVEVEIRFQHVIPHNTCNVWKRELLQTLKKMMIKMSASLKELDIRKVRALQVWNTLGGLS